MQDGRFSTIKFNEWICVTAQYEKAVARLGRQVYQGYSRGILTDFTSIEICKEISETFGEAREIRADLEEELERDALDGLNVEETKQADEHRQLTQAQLTKRNLKLKFTKFMGRQAINRSLATHRDRVKELSRDLGLRARAVYKEEPVLKVRGHKALCRLAESLDEDSDVKWQEIVTVNKETGSSLSFHTILISFIGNFANFSKGTAIGKFLLKYFKYDEDEENKKLSQQYEGSSTAEALKAQMEEIDEPHLDVGREIDNMQQEYEETPAEWGIPSGQSTGEDLSPYFQDDPDPEPEPLEKWEPQSDTWDPDAAVDEDFLDVVADAPEFSPPPEPETFEPEPPPSPAGPTLLRRRPEPQAESWLESSPSPEPAAPSLPRVGQSPAPAAAPTPAGDDWNWNEENNEDPWADSNTSQESAEDPFGAQAMGQGQAAPDPFQQQAPTPPPPAQAPNQGGHRPPFMKSQPAPSAAPVQEKPLGDWSQPAPAAQEKPLGDWSQPAPAAQEKPLGDWSQPAPAAQEKPLGDWSQPAPAAQEKPLGDWSQPAPAAQEKPLGDWSQSAPPAQEKPLGDWSQPAATPATPEKSAGDWSQTATSSSSGWGSSKDQGFGWDSEAPAPAPEPPKQQRAPQAPAAPAPPQRPAAPAQSPAPQAPVRAQTPPPSPSSEDSLGDDLLPAFLKNRTQDESDSSTFIPELPTSLGGESAAPQLEIVPFGSKENSQSRTDEDSDEEPFIPQMPDL